ncbi:glycosyltransferase family 39 protein [Leptolyngbya iicbica]|uniref:Glycosyltransferase family 39 protein n=1 Tax=Lyngbya confervoides BDU141951 TaxID=1574623 RepID=A0A8T6QSS3_9CYAN|nr:glycosyltransferase family 39 protein [Leptolyngbya sp. LK]
MSQLLTWGALVYGVVLRLGYYSTNRSLWHDEAAVTLNILNRSYGELLQQLDYGQAAPPLFLWTQKAVTQLLGPSEYALRLLPVTASVLSLGLFYHLLQRYASRWARPIAMTLFATMGYVLYFAAEVKPYAGDLAIALALFLVLMPLSDRQFSRRQQVGFSLLGAASIWLSYPSVFMLAATAVATAIDTPRSRRWSQLQNRLPVYGVWLASFLGLYLGVIQNTLEAGELEAVFESRFPSSVWDVWWLVDALGRVFYRPLGFLGIPEGFAAIACLTGCIWLYRYQRRTLVLLLLPIGVTLLAGYLQHYPFRDRLILFLAPFGFLLIAEGIAWPLRQPRWWGKAWGWLLVAVLLVPVTWRTTTQAFQTDTTPLFHAFAIRPAVQYIQSNWQESDVIFVESRGRRPFQYYAQRFDFASDDHILSDARLPAAADVSVEYFDEILTPFADAPRLWLFFVLQSDSLPAPDDLLTVLNDYFQSEPLDVLKTSNTLTCLYEPASATP